VNSKKREEALALAQKYARYSDTHPSTLSFRLKCKEAFDMYDGNQWHPQDLETLKERGQRPLTNNYINNMINAASGIEIQTKFRSAVRSFHHDEESFKKAKALTSFLYYIQETEKIPYKQSLKARDAFTCGIGWSNTFKEKKGGYKYQYVHPWNMLPDPDDLSPQYTNSAFVGCKRYMSIPHIKRYWPDSSKEITELETFFNESYGYGNQSAELLDRQSTGFSDIFYASPGGNRLLIVEVQWKETKNSYCGIDDQGNYFETFNQEEAEELAESKKKITINKNASQIMRAVFCDNILLEYAPLEPRIPNLQDFSYIPIVLMREFVSGMPYGLVKLMTDPQREINSRHTKALFLDGSKSIIADGDMMNGRDIEKLRKEAKRADSVFLKPSGTDLKIMPNNPLGESQMRMLEKSEQQIQMVSGIFKDLLGSPSNAQSGIAIERRQVQSIKNHIYAFDSIKLMKQRETEFLLQLIKSSGEENIAFSNILDEEEREYFILNLVKEDMHGNKVMFNDVRTLPVSVYVEEVPDYASSFEERRDNFSKLLSNPSAPLIMRSGMLMKDMLGFRDGDKIAEEIKNAQKEIDQENTQKQQGVQQPENNPETLAQQALNIV
jgi:hypothetical protein